MTFATKPELEAFLNRTFESAESTQVTAVLDYATAVIRNYTNQTISQATTTDEVFDPQGRDVLVLPEVPVTAVTAVKVVAADDTETTLTFGVNEDYWWRSNGLLYRVGGNWGTARNSVKVTYTHGYATIPDDIKLATLQLASKVMDNPHNIRQESVGSYSVTYAGASDELLVSSVRPMLAAYRILQLA